MISDDESPLPGTEVHYLRSEHVGDEFKILVGHCGSSDARRPSVVFVSDPNILFGTALEMLRLFHMFERVPPILVIGVGYRETEFEVVLGLRARDLSATVDASQQEDASLMGGADRFLAFFRDELKPWVRARFDVDPDDSTFFGDSLAGLFATHVLLSEPATFRRYGIGSPSLWWDQKTIFETETAYAASHDDLSAKVFVSVGELETPEGTRRQQEQLHGEARANQEAEDEKDGPLDLVADAARMVSALRSRRYPSLVIESEVLPGEYHETALPVNLSRSVRYLFDMPR